MCRMHIAGWTLRAASLYLSAMSASPSAPSESAPAGHADGHADGHAADPPEEVAQPLISLLLGRGSGSADGGPASGWIPGKLQVASPSVVI